MTMQGAKDVVDWLQSVGCRVLAYMGGEPLVRKNFIIDLTRYATEQGFFVYLPTNGILLDEPFIDEIGRAGVSTVNLAVDAVEPYEGIPKSFSHIRSQCEHLVKKGKISAPMVIGRDHLDTGSVASPYRETEGMKDGSDAIADWPILNALLNAVCGASWVSVHHGGGVGIGLSIHAGMVIVADGEDTTEKRLERVLTVDPGLGVARHADAGYEEAIKFAREKKIEIPMLK